MLPSCNRHGTSSYRTYGISYGTKTESVKVTPGNGCGGRLQRDLSCAQAGGAAHIWQAFGVDPHPVLLKATWDSDHSWGGPSNISHG